MRQLRAFQIVASVVVTLTYAYVHLYVDFDVPRELVRITGVTVNGTVGDQSESIDARARETADENTPRALNEPLAPSSDLCEELVRISSDHRRVIELLTRAQFPSALSPTDYDDSSIALQPASSVQFECDAGKTLDEPRNIVDVFLFGGGEVDTLEIRLYELHPVVDKFIAVTSNVTHKGEATFDALESLLQTARFESFRDKVEIFKHAQAGAAAPNGVNFQFEAEKESAIARELAKRYDEKTLVIFGHVDEIPAREDVWKAARCETALPGNFGIWFPYGNLNFAFRSDFPARNMPWTLGDPGVTVANRLDQMRLPRGRMEHVLGRGFHATNYCFPPQYILKLMTATEYSGFDDFIENIKSGTNKTCEQTMQELRLFCLNDPVRAYGARMRRVDELVKAGENAEQFYTPLALRLSNMTRYPSWDPTGQAIDQRATILPGER